jgi:hypothetical protein
MNKVKVTYRHQIKENTILEVAGHMESEADAPIVLVRRLDGVLIDIPRQNVIKIDQLS